MISDQAHKRMIYGGIAAMYIFAIGTFLWAAVNGDLRRATLALALTVAFGLAHLEGELDALNGTIILVTLIALP